MKNIDLHSYYQCYVITGSVICNIYTIYDVTTTSKIQCEKKCASKLLPNDVWEFTDCVIIQGDGLI